MSPPVLLTGASGQLGGYLLHELKRKRVPIVAWSGARTGAVCGMPLRPVDLSEPDQIAAAFREARPYAVIHAGAMASIAECLRDPERARRVNMRGTATLAELAAESVALLVYVSTDLVFDGEKGGYSEQDTPSPLSVYGRTKAEAEKAVGECPYSVVVRLSLLYGPTRIVRPSFFDQQVAAILERRPMALFEDEWRTPLDLRTAARALVALTGSDFTGTLHVGGPERMSRLEMGQRLAKCLSADPSVFVAATRASVPSVELRPRDTSLDSSRWRELFPNQPWPTLEAAIREMTATS